MRLWVLWLGLGFAHAAPRTPCTDAPAALQALAERLLATQDRGSLVRLAEDAAAMSYTGGACSAYVAGSAWFFLSATGADRRFHAARAVSNLVRAQALDPAGMADVQPQSRLREAWNRLGEVPGWLEGPPRAVSVRATGRLSLAPADASAWMAACGALPTCDRAADIRALVAGEVQIILRPGRYRWTLLTECGQAEGVATVADAGLELAPPACTRTVEAVDESAQPNEIIVDSRVVRAEGEAPGRVGEEVTLEAPGYQPVRVRIQAGPGPQRVPLARCPVDLRVVIRPADALVEGAGLAPWGVRSVRARRVGYADLTMPVEVPRPVRCAGALHEVGLELGRPVRVVALRGEQPTVLDRLWVQGRPVDPAGFVQPPGTYGFQAEHATLGTRSGEFSVLPCGTGTCAATTLRVLYDRPTRTGPWWVVAGGGAALLAGGAFGAGALKTDEQIQAYTTRRNEARSIADLVDERDRQATLANMGVGLGLALVVGGLVWLVWED